MTLGQMPVHLEQVARPQRGFLPPGAAADLDDDILALIGILGDEERLESGAELGGPAVELLELLGEVGGHLGIRAVASSWRASDSCARVDRSSR